MLLNGKVMVPTQYTLIAMSHPQPDNGNSLNSNSKAGFGIVQYFMKPKHSKYWDIRYHWLEYRTKMGHLNLYWERGIYNWAGYFTKHHPPYYHQIMRHKYLQKLHTITNQIMSTKFILFAPQAAQCVRVCQSGP